MALAEPTRQFLSSRGWLSCQPYAFREALLDIGELREWPEGEAMFNMGDEQNGMVALVSGWVSITVAPFGSEPMLIHVSGPGAWGGDVAMILDSDRIAIAMARTDCVMAHFPKSKMLELAKTIPDFWKYVATQTIGHMAHAHATIATGRQSDPMARVCLTLLRLVGDGFVYGINNTGHLNNLPLSQYEVAELASMSRNPVNTALKKLERQGAIQLGYRIIRVLDVGLLRAGIA